MIGTIIGLSINDPYVPISYSISRPNGSFIRMAEVCPSDAGRHYFTTTTRSGRQASIELCLLAMSFGTEERRLIPYRVDEKNMIWGETTYSSEVSAYEKTLEKRFALPTQDVDGIEKEISARYWKQWREGLGYLSIGLIAFTGIVWIVGWIARGFMSIPSGMDKKPSSEA